jgi:hypothetical protein
MEKMSHHYPITIGCFTTFYPSLPTLSTRYNIQKVVNWFRNRRYAGAPRDEATFVGHVVHSDFVHVHLFG